MNQEIRRIRTGVGIMQKKAEAYRYEYDDYNIFELEFNKNYEGKERVEIIDKAIGQLDNDVSVRLPYSVALAFAKKILEKCDINT